MEVPTGATVREVAKTNDGDGFDWTRYGYPEPEGEAPDRLDRQVARAVAYVAATTGRSLDASMPAELAPLAEDAVLMRTIQQLVGRGGTRELRNAIRSMDLISMRAGDYAETRAGATRSGPGYALTVNPWRELSDVLLLLATPERRAQLMAEWGGQPVAAATVVETAPWGGVDDPDH